MSNIKDRFSPLLSFLRRNRLYLIWLVGLILCIVFAGLDNPTGIVLGWLAVTILFLVLFRRWRRPRYYLFLLAATFFGAIFLSFLYSEVALRLALWLGGPDATDSAAWRVFHAVISNIMLLGAPVGIFYGFTGFVIFGIVNLVNLVKRDRAGRGT